MSTNFTNWGFGADTRRGPEWPTWLALAAVYGAFGAVSWYHAELPGLVLVLAGGFITAFHGSLQHEALHGHPTRSRWLNELLVFPTPWLWIPYRVYRRSHLLHHRDKHITDPIEDPESFYVSAQRWGSIGRPTRALLRANNTLLGRLTIGPPLAVARLLHSEPKRALAGDHSVYVDWGWHALSCALILTWVLGVCGMSFWTYVLAFAYPGLSLALLRSFAEHRAAEKPSQRTVIVEAGPVLSLLFLNNNLHAVHHAEPGTPWYALPARWRADRERTLAENGGYYLAGYGEIAWRWLLRAKETPAHPFA